MNGRSMTGSLKFRTLFFASVLALAGCITINIYFPAAAAEKAADRIIDDVLGNGAAAAPAAPAK